MSTARRAGGLVLAVMAAGHLAYGEEAGTDAPRPADAPAAPAAPAADPTERPAAPPIALHGVLRSRYVGRWTDGASDHDQLTLASLTLGDREADRVTAHLLADLVADLDGNTGHRGHYAFDSTRDSRGRGTTGRIYSAYVDIHRTGPLSLVRLGRQSLYDVPEISYFDGARIDSREFGATRVKLGAYGGVAVRLYDTYDADEHLVGSFIEGRPWRGARYRLDWERLVGDGEDDISHANDLVGASGWQRFGRYANLYSRWITLDGESRDIYARGAIGQPDWDARLQVSYYQLLLTRDGATVETDAFYPVLRSYVPYREVRATASKGFGDHVALDGGVDIRRLVHDEEEGAFNREFERYFATLSLFDIGVQGSSASVTAEQWVSDGRRIASHGADLTCPLGARNKVSVGTAYALYKYDAESDQERIDVRTYYLKLEHRFSRELRVGAVYEREDGDFGLYHEARCEAVCTF